MNWMTKIFSCAVLMALFFSTNEVRAAFNGGAIHKKLTAIESTEHGVIFSRLQDGKVLFEFNSDLLLSPASVTKILTSAVTLSYFGPSFSFKTPIYYTGKLEKNRLQGDIFIKGNGDPFLVSEILWQTAVDLKHLGIKEITGNIFIDNSLFDDETHDTSRQHSLKTSAHAYDAPVSAFAVNFNTVAVATTPTTKGQPALAETTPFSLRNAKITSSTITTGGRDNSQVTLTRTALPTGGVLLKGGGHIGVDAPIKKIYRSAVDPTITAGDYIVRFLETSGIKIGGHGKSGKTPQTARLLYEIVGFEVRRIIQGLNTFSNNFIADMLTKRLGAAFGNGARVDTPHSGSFASGVKVLTDFLRKDLGIKTDFKIFNGSGLSTENRLSARQILSVLNHMETRGELYPDFLASLPANGWDGTLRKRINKDDTLAGQIHAKSGTLTAPITVASLAGYFRHPKEGWVSFVMISNGRRGKMQPGLSELRHLQDNVLKGIFMN